MNQFRFLEWNVYKDSKNLLELILRLVKRLPKEYRFELGSQMVRCAFSVILNIAEGSGKTSDKELNRFLEISLGSVSELVAAVDVLKDNQLVNQDEFNMIFAKSSSISSQLGGFKKKIKKS